MAAAEEYDWTRPYRTWEATLKKQDDEEDAAAATKRREAAAAATDDPIKQMLVDTLTILAPFALCSSVLPTSPWMLFICDEERTATSRMLPDAALLPAGSTCASAEQA